DLLGELDLAPLRDEQRVVARLRVVAPHVAHLGGALEVVALAPEREPVAALLVGGLVERGARLHAQQRLVRVGVLGLGVVQVVGRQQRGPELLAQPDEVGQRAPLDLQPVVHDLDEEVVLAEDVLQLAGGAARLVVLAEPQPGLDLARGAAAGRDQPLRVGLHELAVDARPLAELALERGERAHPEQVVHAGGVLGQQRHVRVRAARGHVVGALGLVAPPHTALVEPAGARRHVRLDADDRLDVELLGGAPEVVGAEQVAVVGGGQRGLAEPLRLGEQLLHPCGAVQHRVLGVDVEVDEVVGAARARGGHDPQILGRLSDVRAATLRPVRTRLGVVRTGPWQDVARAVGLLAPDGGTRPTIFAEMSALALATGSVNLGQGFPDEDGPESVKQVAARALLDGVNQYPPGPGVPALRQAVAAHQQRHYGIELDPDTEVLVTTGATEAIAAALLALVGPGEAVVTLEPFYDAYAAVVALTGAELVTV